MSSSPYCHRQGAMYCTSTLFKGIYIYTNKLFLRLTMVMNIQWEKYSNKIHSAQL